MSPQIKGSKYRPKIYSNLLRLDQERFLHDGDREMLEYPESSLGYRWNIPIFYTSGNEYKLEWILTDEDLVIEGDLGTDIWIDPEANSFMRLNHGQIDTFINVSAD